MRITEGLITDKYLFNYEKISNKKIKIQTQLANNSRIENLSDDLSSSLEAIRLNAQINKTQAYIKNAEKAQGFMNATLSTLDLVTNEVQNIISKVTLAGDVLNQQNYSSIAQSIKDSLSSIIQSVNTKYNDMYLFGGTNYSADPLSTDVNGKAVVSLLDHSGEVFVQLSNNTKEAMNIPGDQVLNSGLFESINNVIDSLLNGDAPSQAQKQALDSAYQSILNVQSLGGEKINRLDNLHNLLKAQSDNYQELLVKQTEVDIPKLVTDLQQQDYLLQLASKLVANAYPKSIYDYL